jgi:hypothetical protein
MIKRVVCFLFIVGMALSAKAEGISVLQSIDKSEIPFEGEAHFEIVIEWNGPQSAYLFDQPLRPLFDRLRAQGFSSSIASTGSGADEITTKRYSYTLKPTQSGTGRIDPIVIMYLVWPDSIPGQLITEVMTVDIAQPVPVAESTGPGVWGIVIIVVVVGAVGSAAWWYIRWSSSRKRQPVVKSPAEMFLDGLGALKQETDGDLKRFQTGLYKLLHTFLGAKYGVRNAVNSVSDIVEDLNGTGMLDSHRERISGWLVRAEKEKFSPVSAAPGETLRLEAEIREFFERNML